MPPLRLLLLCLLLAPLISCLHILSPRHAFGHYAPPPAPDYAQAAQWAALPQRPDCADCVPTKSSLRDQQDSAAADVFFIHRTTFVNTGAWNAPLDKKRLNRAVDHSTIRHQASVFNAAARVYAPRYRQATLYSFFDEQANGQQAIDLAYSDIKTAFAYYLAHYNQGRPIILAGHSQGTVHATRLLHDFFENDPALRRRLVAAYLIGFPTHPDEFTTLRPCPDSLATGCFVTWNAVAKGNEYAPYAHSTVTNPLTWTLDTLLAPARLNHGGVGFPFRRINPQATDAQAHNGLLWITPPGGFRYMRFILPGKAEFRHSFHLADYGLFYVNLRRNAHARVLAWLREQH